MIKDKKYYGKLEESIDSLCGEISTWYEDDRREKTRKTLQNAKELIQHLRKENKRLNKENMILLKDLVQAKVDNKKITEKLACDIDIKNQNVKIKNVSYDEEFELKVRNVLDKIQREKKDKKNSFEQFDIKMKELHSKIGKGKTNDEILKEAWHWAENNKDFGCSLIYLLEESNVKPMFFKNYLEKEIEIEKSILYKGHVFTFLFYKGIEYQWIEEYFERILFELTNGYKINEPGISLDDLKDFENNINKICIDNLKDFIKL